MPEPNPLRPAQCRAGRALLEWSQERLAKEASVGRMTVKRLEAGQEVRTAQALSIRRSLEQAGVIVLKDGAPFDGQQVFSGVALTTPLQRP